MPRYDGRNTRRNKSRAGNSSVLRILTISVVLAVGAIIWYSISPRAYTLPMLKPVDVQAMGHDQLSETSVIVSVTPSSPSPTQAEDNTDTSTFETTALPTQTPAPDPLAQHFLESGIEYSDWSYKSDQLSVEIEKVQENDITYFVADVWVRDPQFLKTVKASDSVGVKKEFTTKMAIAEQSILAINGDYFGFRETGVIIRNGELIRNKPDQEILAIFDDGSMKTYRSNGITAQELLDQGAVDTFSFGPMLIEEGKAIEDFTGRTTVNPANPRTGVGMVEPYHYVFILVDGRQAGYSRGMTMPEFAATFEKYGCTVAYNMDGGGTSSMAFMGRKVNQTATGTARKVSDILYVFDQPSRQEGILPDPEA